MDLINETIEKLQSGDIQTAVIVLVGLLITFFILKLLVNSFKAIIIVIAIIVLITVFLPEVNIIDKTKQISADAVDKVKEYMPQKALP